MTASDVPHGPPDEDEAMIKQFVARREAAEAREHELLLAAERERRIARACTSGIEQLESREVISSMRTNAQPSPSSPAMAIR